MDADLLLKNVSKESHLFGRRVVVAVLIVLVLTGLLLARMVYLQIIHHTHYRTLSENNRLRILPIPPGRGLIYDRNGVILAENQPSFTLEIIPEQVEEPWQELLARLRQVVAISDYDVERFKKFRGERRGFEKIPLSFRLEEREVARLAVIRHTFPGVYISATLTRSYPLGAYAVHAIGYVGRINEAELQKIDPVNYRGTTYIGKTGLEKFYEDVLHGTVGHQQVEADVQGRVVRVLERTSPLPGSNLYLNLDIRLQRFAEDLLRGKRAALVALDPRTGGVLALVSMPGFDPNLFVNGIDHQSYDALNTSLDQPLFNRTILGQYPPGSTIKSFVGLAGLEYGVVTGESRTYCPGWYTLPGQDHRYRDWKRSGHGWMNLFHAIEQSCDIYFYDLASHLGIDRMSKFLGRFSFGRKTGIDIGGELSGLMPTTAWKQRTRRAPWYPGETLISGIGQGFTLATPLQLAVATAALSRRGQLRSPRLAALIDHSDHRYPEINKSHSLIHVAPPRQEDWDLVITAMRAVVHGRRGTARAQGRDIPYQMAGKTGTAQVVRLRDEDTDNDDLPERHQDHALFIAFAPLEAPRIALSLIVENGGSGGRTAAPLARQVIDYYLEDLTQTENAPDTPE